MDKKVAFSKPLRFSLYVLVFSFSCKHFHNLTNHPFPLGRVITPNSGGDAGVQMPVQYQTADFLQRRLNGLDLFDNVNTIGPILNHFADTPDMPFNAF